MAARYWRNTTGADCILSTGCFTTVENMRDPAGETQTLAPRPRPAICAVAVAVNPCGNWRSSFIFLLFVRAFHLIEIESKAYFSRIVFVLVNTSPYKRLDPNVEASPLDSI